MRIAVRFRMTGCEWNVLAPEGIPPQFATSPIESRDAPLVDAWDVRQRFLAARSTDDLLKFLRSTGRFTNIAATETWDHDDLHLWQRVVERLMVTKPEEWPLLINTEFGLAPHGELAAKFTGQFTVRFTSTRTGYVGVVVARTALMAMLASTYIDWMSGVKFDFCLRPDCRRPFAITSGHHRSYCGEKCRHLELVRRARANEKQMRADSNPEPHQPR